MDILPLLDALKAYPKLGTTLPGLTPWIIFRSPSILIYRKTREKNYRIFQNLEFQSRIDPVGFEKSWSSCYNYEDAPAF
jgi:hypothetical protein